MTPDSLSQMLSDFLDGARAAVVVEDGAIAFDLAEAKYSVSGEYHKCLLHLWSSERNFVRRVLDAEVKATTLRLQVQRMGQNRPTRLDFCRDRDQRSPAARRAARVAYEPRLRRALERNFPEWTVVRLTTSVDLEHSFGPAYLRGWLRQGQRALAIVGVNDQETQSTVDGALTCGILWLDACRLAQRERRVVEGLTMVVPKGTVALTRQRMAHLHPTAAKWSLYEFDQGEDALVPVDTGDRGNLATRLVHSIDEGLARERFVESMARIRGILPQSEVVVLSPASISFRRHGLEFAQARMAHDPRNFESSEQIIFGVGPEERILDSGNETQFADLVRLAASVRHKDGPKNHALWRMHPERWLESLVAGDIAALDGRLQPESVYAQVPAFAAADRAMIDILAATRESRLAVIELKADEDIHLPCKGWITGLESPGIRAAESLRNLVIFRDAISRRKSPCSCWSRPRCTCIRQPTRSCVICRRRSIGNCWELERWREEIRVVFRKRPVRAAHLAIPA